VVSGAIFTKWSTITDAGGRPVCRGSRAFSTIGANAGMQLSRTA
jgi:hypothetical protein